MNTTNLDTKTRPAVIIRRIECAARLGVSLSTLDRLVKQERIAKPARIGARSVGWPESYLDSLIAGTTNTDTHK